MEGDWEKEWDNEKEDTDVMFLTTATESTFGFICFLYLSILHTFKKNTQSSVGVCHVDTLPVVKWHIKQFNHQYKPVINLLIVWQLTMKILTRNGEPPQQKLRENRLHVQTF